MVSYDTIWYLNHFTLDGSALFVVVGNDVFLWCEIIPLEVLEGILIIILITKNSYTAGNYYLERVVRKPNF